MNQIKKWGCHFDGRDPLSFLERVNELHRQYRYSDEIIMDGLPELLQGEVLSWYRNFQEEWHTMDDFYAPSVDSTAALVPDALDA